MVRRWLQDRPPRPDLPGQLATEQAVESVITEVEARAEQLITSTAQHDPQLAAKVEANARRRKLEIERDLILRRRSVPR